MGLYLHYTRSPLYLRGKSISTRLDRLICYSGPAWPMLAACFTLYLLRDLDTKFTIGFSRAGWKGQRAKANCKRFCRALKVWWLKNAHYWTKLRETGWGFILFSLFYCWRSPMESRSANIGSSHTGFCKTLKKLFWTGKKTGRPIRSDRIINFWGRQCIQGAEW